VRPLPKPVTLAEIKAEPSLADLALVRLSRLSVVPVSKQHWDKICRMGGWKI
jgi:predicted RNA-binding protein with PUA-like domain